MNTPEIPASPSPRTRPRRAGQRIPSAAERARLQDAFLTEFATCGVVKLAAERVGVTRRSVYWWCEDPAFKTRFKEAEEEACDTIRAEVYRRAVEGFTETITTAAGTKTLQRFDGSLLKMLAMSRMPEFREHIDVTTGNQPFIRYDALINDPESAELAARLAERTAVVGVDPSRSSTDR